MIRVVGAQGIIQDLDLFLSSLEEFCKKFNVVIQAMNADVIFGEKHLISAAKHAMRAFKQKTNSTNSLAMETMLYASGERQIKLAIEKMGVQKNKSNIALVLISEAKEQVSQKNVDEIIDSLNLKINDKVLEGDINTLKKFGITDEEIKTVTKAKYDQLILEKVALVDIIK